MSSSSPGRGVRPILLRCAGINQVDLVAAHAYGIHVRRVPADSPHAVAELTLGMMLTLNRRFHRAYNRVSEGNFSIEGLMGVDFSALGGRDFPLEELFATADLISLHCPLTPETHHLINRHVIENMRDGVMIINTSHSTLLTAGDLIEALKRGILARPPLAILMTLSPESPRPTKFTPPWLTVMENRS